MHISNGWMNEWVRPAFGNDVKEMNFNNNIHHIESEMKGERGL